MKKFTLIALALLTLLGANHGFSAAMGVNIIDRGVGEPPLFAGVRTIHLDAALDNLDALTNVIVDKLHTLGIAAATVDTVRLFDDHDRPLSEANIASILQRINVPVAAVPGALGEGYPFELIAVQLVPVPIVQNAIPD